MDFPEEVLIKVIDATTRLPVPHLAMKITLFAPKKNNYTIALVTNASGIVALPKEHVRQSIEEDWKLFPMDYVSRLEDCSPEIEIRTCSPEDVRATVEAMREFGPTAILSANLIGAFDRAINARYSPTSKRINVEEMNPAEVEINPK